MVEDSVYGRSLRAATSTAKDLPAEVLPNAPESYPCEGASKSDKSDKDDGSPENLSELIHDKTLHVEGRETKFCYWCHEQLETFPEDASYVDEINHYMHESCRHARDRYNRQMEKLRAGVKDGSIDSIPEVVRKATLQRMESLGFTERCRCLYDPDFGFKGYDLFLDDEECDLDEQNSAADCALCGGTGKHDRLPELVGLTDDKKAEAWVAEHFTKASGPCDHWPGFPEEGWYCDSLGYNRTGKDAGRGITLYNIDFMKGGIITWLEIADLFRPRVQSSLF